MDRKSLPWGKRATRKLYKWRLTEVLSHPKSEGSQQIHLQAWPLWHPHGKLLLRCLSGFPPLSPEDKAPFSMPVMCKLNMSASNWYTNWIRQTRVLRNAASSVYALVEYRRTWKSVRLLGTNKWYPSPDPNSRAKCNGCSLEQDQTLKLTHLLITWELIRSTIHPYVCLFHKHWITSPCLESTSIYRQSIRHCVQTEEQQEDLKMLCM